MRRIARLCAVLAVLTSGRAQALDIVPDGAPLEQPEAAYTKIVACLSAKGAYKSAPAALQAAQEECEAKATSITLNEYIAMALGCTLTPQLDDVSQSLCVSGVDKLRPMFAPNPSDEAVATRTLKTAELLAMDTACPHIPDYLSRTRCAAGISKVKSQAALASKRGIVQADELDGGCAQVKRASSIVICSDPELRQQAIARNKLFEAARAKLNPEAYKTLTDDQSQWIKSYTAKCGVSVDGPVPSLPIPSSIIECYRRESTARAADLAARLGKASPAALPPPTSDSYRDEVKDMLSKLFGSRQAAAMIAWNDCTEHAAESFADQPEPARTVAEAAMAACTAEETKYMLASGIQYPASVEGATMPHLLARVMAFRAVRAKLRHETPKPSPAINYNHM
jgi:uncharacterized protein YecT (DUF1311 family)